MSGTVRQGDATAQNVLHLHVVEPVGLCLEVAYAGVGGVVDQVAAGVAAHVDHHFDLAKLRRRGWLGSYTAVSWRALTAVR